MTVSLEYMLALMRCREQLSAELTKNGSESGAKVPAVAQSCTGTPIAADSGVNAPSFVIPEDAIDELKVIRDHIPHAEAERLQRVIVYLSEWTDEALITLHKVREMCEGW